MRGLAVVLAAGAGWTLAGAPLPRVRLPKLPRIPARSWAGAAIVGLLTFVLALGLTATPAIAIAFGAMGAAVPFWKGGAAAARQAQEIVDGWPDFLASLRSRLAGGASLPEAFVAAAEQGPPRLAAAAEEITDGVMSGTEFAVLLEQLRADLADPTADRVLTTIVAAQRAGGQRVGAMLGALGVSIADELRLRKAHQAALTQQRLTAGVALVAPWGLLLLTVASNPQAASAYRTASGTKVVLVGFCATSLGYVLARRAARLSKPPRLFE